MPKATNQDVQISYEDRGQGDAVVFLPGLGMRGATWDAHATRVAERRRAVVIDPRGSGASDTPDHPYLPEAVAGDVVAVLDDAGIDRAHVVGQSMGGMIAQDLVLRHPERVRSLTLVSTFGAADDWSRGVMDGRRRMIAAAGLELQFAVSIHYVFSPKSFRELQPFIAGLVARLESDPPDERAYLRQIDYIVSHDALARLGDVNVPALVVAGGDDVLTSAIQNRELAAAIPGARYEEFETASHGLIWEEPERFGDLLTTFFKEAERT